LIFEGNPTMADAKRPLSPHLQVYRWGPHMLVSILHRATGDGLAFAGGALLVWGLIAAASGPAAYGLFVAVMTSKIGYLVMFGLSFAFFQHLCSGLRHLHMDTGAGYELGLNRKLALATMICSTLLTVLLWAVVLL
jgi:succinate dehydrogenase / fumarate reductase, cytochrome b subunit